MNCLYTALCDLAAERQTPGRCVCPGFIIDETILLGVPSRFPSPSGSHGNISGSRRVCSGLHSDSRALQEADNLSKLSRVRSHTVMHFTNRDCETAPWQLWGGAGRLPAVSVGSGRGATTRKNELQLSGWLLKGKVCPTISKPKAKESLLLQHGKEMWFQVMLWAGRPLRSRWGHPLARTLNNYHWLNVKSVGGQL